LGPTFRCEGLDEGEAIVAEEGQDQGQEVVIHANHNLIPGTCPCMGKRMMIPEQSDMSSLPSTFSFKVLVFAAGWHGEGRGEVAGLVDRDEDRDEAGQGGGAGCSRLPFQQESVLTRGQDPHAYVERALSVLLLREI